ncbi:unnamed protein product [Linum trigynum]|uniref:Uncharacterized protein n=1 Tax=Linum trigynum TaxID=586398 RepID=A0AAV2GN62_9ROSI
MGSQAGDRGKRQGNSGTVERQQGSQDWAGPRGGSSARQELIRAEGELPLRGEEPVMEPIRRRASPKGFTIPKPVRTPSLSRATALTAGTEGETQLAKPRHRAGRKEEVSVGTCMAPLRSGRKQRGEADWGKEARSMVGSKPSKRALRKGEVKVETQLQQAARRRKLLLEESEEDEPSSPVLTRAGGSAQEGAGGEKKISYTALAGNPPEDASSGRDGTRNRQQPSRQEGVEEEVVVEDAQQAARKRKGKMVVVEEESEEWEPPFVGKGVGEEDSDATLLDGVADQFEIRSRAPRGSDSAHQPNLAGRVKQVVQAFEAGTVVLEEGRGVEEMVNGTEAPARIDEYGSNASVMGMGGRKRSWNMIADEAEESPTVKRQFVEAIGTEELISVEEASRKWPQEDR